jgi:hypothetical protein
MTLDATRRIFILAMSEARANAHTYRARTNRGRAGYSRGAPEIDEWRGVRNIIDIQTVLHRPILEVEVGIDYDD